MKIKLIAVGKLKEGFFIEACGEYEKRISRYGDILVCQLPESGHLEKEGELIEKEIFRGSFIIAMCVEGKGLSSTELADKISSQLTAGKSGITIIIGSSDGICPRIKDMAHLKLSMSKMTFPHHLARVMVLEQLYRALNILDGGKYHK